MQAEVYRYLGLHLQGVHPIGHKTGDYPPHDANDVGIVYAPSGPIVIAVFANDLGGDYEQEEERIGRISRVIIDHFIT